MCGIAGALGIDGTPFDRPGLERMVRSIAHRGPDALSCRSYGNGVAGLGHARLSIIDLSTGGQPMTSEDGSVGLVFNGEIYNYLEIRERLERDGVRFRTTSDTEAILRLYQERGADAIPHLRGMFAFAIYDHRRRSLLLARDRLGKKPLFWCRTGERLLFASEMKAILAYLGEAPAVDWSFLGDYLALGYIPEPATPYQAVRKLPAAHSLLFEDGEVTIERYWSPPRFEARAESGRETRERLGEALRESVEIRLRSDVEFGSLLSSGIDSSLVTAMMVASGKLARPARTFTVGFRDQRHNELPEARAIARHLGTRHEEEVLELAVDAVLPRIAWHMEEPFADSSTVPTYYVSSMAARRVKMVLSGDGGDELFSGYQRYRRVAQLASLRRIAPLARATALAAACLPGIGRPAARLGRYLGECSAAAYTELVGIFPPGEIHQLGVDLKEGYPPPFISGLWNQNGHSDLDRAMYTDLQTYLLCDVLVKVDRMSMAHSLEVRSPLLDHQVVEVAATIPVAMKRPRPGRGKMVLREMAAELVPPRILRLPKHGFSAPVDSWYRGDLGHSLREEIGVGEEVLSRLDQTRIKALLSPASLRNPTSSERLFAIHTLLLWHRLYVRDLAKSLSTFEGKGSRLAIDWGGDRGA